jgi:hypothetical protein
MREEFPNFDGYDLAQIEMSSVEFLTLIFSGTKKLPNRVQTLYLHLYHPSIATAEFVCAPYFPRTITVELHEMPVEGKWKIAVQFAEGKLEYHCKHCSFFELETDALEVR